MVRTVSAVLPSLYTADETAWLEAMAELIREGRFAELDHANLGEYLTDMARRDRREVNSRLRVLLTHLLQWHYQPEKRTGSWRGTIIAQRQELADAAGAGVLRSHAAAVLPEAYTAAVERAAAETGLAAATFPGECPFTLDQVLAPAVLDL